jgi:hypothetical protein
MGESPRCGMACTEIVPSDLIQIVRLHTTVIEYVFCFAKGKGKKGWRAEHARLKFLCCRQGSSRTFKGKCASRGRFRETLEMDVIINGGDEKAA